MIKRLYYFLCMSAVLGIAASCEKTDKVLGTEVELTAHIQDFETKGVAPEVWAGGEELAIRALLESGTEIRKYTASASGVLNAASEYTPFTILDEQESLRMSIWHPFSETVSQWTVNSDQSKAEDYRASDFMYAKEFSAVRGGNDVTLYHQMARLSVNLIASDEVSLDKVTEVGIGNGDIATQGNFTAPESEGEAYGTWTPGQATGTIKAYKNSDESYKAIIIPQNVTGKTLVTVTLNDGKKLTFTQSSQMNLASGCQYEIDLIVYSDGLVEDKGTMYNSRDLKPGDYFYSDGTWSDGGLRDITEDGMVWEEEKPSPVAGKNVIGIVFCTDPERIGEGEKEALADLGVSEPHGLVLSTKSFSDNRYIKWFDMNGEFSRDETEIGIPEIGAMLGGAEVYEKIDADIEGYRSNMLIRTKRADDLAAGYYPGFKAAMEFADQVGGPDKSAKTTGWYIPANGQLVDIFRHLLGLNLKGTNFVHDTEGIIYWQGLGNSPASLNKLMSKIPASNKTEYPAYNNSLMASSQGNSETMRYIDFTESGYLDCMRDYKNRTVHIRCVLAF